MDLCDLPGTSCDATSRHGILRRFTIFPCHCVLSPDGWVGLLALLFNCTARIRASPSCWIDSRSNAQHIKKSCKTKKNMEHGYMGDFLKMVQFNLKIVAGCFCDFMNTTSAGNVENCKNENYMNMVSGEIFEHGNLYSYMDTVTTGCFVMCAGKRHPLDGSKQLLFRFRRHSRIKPYDKSCVPLSLLYTFTTCISS